MLTSIYYNESITCLEKRIEDPFFVDWGFEEGFLI